MDLEQVLYANRQPYSQSLQYSFGGAIKLMSHRLDFDMQIQTQTNWCWAATATSVSHYYWTKSTWTQCKVANDEMGRTDCCDVAVPTACNQPWYLNLALERTENLETFAGGVESFATIQAEINAGRPVGARIGWSGGGGHFMMIYGYGTLEGVQYLDIDDPIWGKVHLPLTEFTTSYQSSGSWTHTYMTKSNVPPVPFKPLHLKDPILDKIWAAQQFLDPNAVEQRQAAADEAWRRASPGLAHPVYAVGLDELMETDIELSRANPVCVRVLESADGELRAVYDVIEEPEPRVLQMSASQSYLERLSRGLEQAILLVQEEENAEEEVELRLLRVAALNFETLWLHSESERVDWLVPFISLGAVEPFEPIPMDLALETLRSEAGVIAEMDDDMLGA